MPGRIFFAFALIVFGAQHFMYTRFIAAIVPAWIPQHHLWVILTGIALIAAGVAIATTIADKIAGFCLFALFFLWLILLLVMTLSDYVSRPWSGQEWRSETYGRNHAEFHQPGDSPAPTVPPSR